MNKTNIFYPFSVAQKAFEYITECGIMRVHELYEIRDGEEFDLWWVEQANASDDPNGMDFAYIVIQGRTLDGEFVSDLYETDLIIHKIFIDEEDDQLKIMVSFSHS